MSVRRLGIILQGSLSGGVEMSLDQETSVEELRVGRFVVIEGAKARFFSMLTDVNLSVASQKLIQNPPPDSDFIRAVLTGTSTFATARLQPVLMLNRQSRSSLDQDSLEPVKTIPAHFSAVYEAQGNDFALVFGQEDSQDKENFFFNIGRPPDMDTAVCINLERFLQRSNGIFGKSGTGKSFLTRVILSGIISQDLASTLIFDMHNEYGWQAVSEDRSQPTVKGLRQLFGSKVVVFTLDADSSAARGLPDAHELYIGYNQIEIEDLELIRSELALSEATLENAYIMKEKLGESWISKLIAMSGEEIDRFVLEHKGHPASIKTLQRRLSTMIQKTKYLRTRTPANYIDEIIRHIEAGRHIVLEFGRQNNLISYMLATNIITRRIHAEYVRRSELNLSDPDRFTAPRRLAIVIEEAHRFLSGPVARQTIFGVIAREMRKYFVTLIIVDQRPSGIDADVLSQIGTRITALLNDERDIEAVFTGVPGSNALRTVLSQLDPRQQALVLGYAVPMPVVVRTRAFDQAFYKAIATDPLDDTPVKREVRARQASRELFGTRG